MDGRLCRRLERREYQMVAISGGSGATQIGQVSHGQEPRRARSSLVYETCCGSAARPCGKVVEQERLAFPKRWGIDLVNRTQYSVAVPR